MTTTNHITDETARLARALVTDPVRADAAPRAVRMIAWATLKLHRRNRLMALAVFRHRGDVA